MCFAMDGFCLRPRIRWALDLGGNLHGVFGWQRSRSVPLRSRHAASGGQGKWRRATFVFASEHGLGRFTSALAHQVDLNTPAGEFAGDVVETSVGDYLVAWRPDAKARYSLQSWNSKTGAFEVLVAAGDADLVQPVLVEPRRVPNQHPRDCTTGITPTCSA